MLNDERLWWAISVKTPDGTVTEGVGYSPIEAGIDLQRKVADSQAEATRVQQHADNTAKALDVLAAILLPEQMISPPSPQSDATTDPVGP